MKKLFNSSMHSRAVKYFSLCLAVGLVFSAAFSLCGFSAACEKVRQSVLRLHILAHSDDEADQALKLLVRDRILEDTAYLFKDVQTEQQAADAAAQNIDLMEQIARDEIIANGYDYPVTVEVAPTNFGTREYDNVTLPAGRYMAVRVLIGEAEGKNWWCVMFPSMCLPAAGEQQEIDKVLEDKPLEVVTDQPKYKVQFKIVELFESVRDWF